MNPLDKTQEAARDQFESRSANYGKTHILADVSDVNSALASLPFRPGARALDVATGGGHTALYLAGKGLKVTAADISPAMTQNAAALVREKGFVVQTAIHPAEELPYPDKTFQIVTCRVAAHHFSNPSAFVRESARVLEAGGWFLLIDGSVPDGEPEALEWIHHIEKLRDPSHGKFLTPGEWKTLAEDAGLEVESLTTMPLKQPDLNWYFETAGTSPENREAVLKLVREAPTSAEKVFRLENEDGKITWWWPRVTLLARKAGGPL